jgi:hypothetical protein
VESLAEPVEDGLTRLGTLQYRWASWPCQMSDLAKESFAANPGNRMIIWVKEFFREFFVDFGGA